MTVKDVMSRNVVCCTSQDTGQHAAKLMKDHQVGSLPVVEDLKTRHLLGIVTDRDLCTKLMADGRNGSTAVSSAMTHNPITCHDDDSLERCESLMQQHKVRRIPVVGRHGECVGMVAQADIALHDDASHIQRMLKMISSPPSTARSSAAVAN
jgi:CBS domain-containing protein